MRRSLTPQFALLSALALCLPMAPACSLLQLDQVPRPACFNHGQCEGLNTAAGLSRDACERYQCTGLPLVPGAPPAVGLQAGVCALQPQDLDGDGSHPFELAARCRGLGGIWEDCDDNDSRAVSSATPESCDGVDNDCDFIVDETFMAMTGPMQAIIPQTGIAVAPLLDVSDVWISPDPTGALAVAWSSTSSTASYVNVPPGGRGLAGTRMAYASHASETSLRDFNEVQMRCPVLAGGEVRTDGSCNFAEVAVSATETHVFAVGVTRQGCARGILRAGHFARDATVPELLSRGPHRRSSSFLGLALNSCDPPPAPGDPGSPEMLPGAAQPTVTALDLPGQTNDQALAVWINDRADRDACGGESAPVVANALFLQSTLFSGTHYWVTASNEGTPEILGMTLAGARPVVERFGERGWIVGHPDETGAIALHFIPAQAAPRVVDVMDPDPQSRVGVEVPPLSGVIDYAPIVIGAGRRPDDLALTIGRLRTEGLEIILAWREGCGADTQSIWYQRVVVSTDSPTVITAGPLGTEPQEVARATRPSSDLPDPLRAPAVTYGSDGIFRRTPPGLGGMADIGPIRPLFEGGEGPRTIGFDSDGGYLVAWPQASFAGSTTYRLLARRFAEIDGFEVSDNDVLDLTLAGSRADISRIRTYTTDDASEIRVAFTDHARRELVEGRISCVIALCSPTTPTGRCEDTMQYCDRGECRVPCERETRACPGSMSCRQGGFCQ